MFPLSLLSYGAVDVDEVGDVGDAGDDYMMRAMLLGHSVVVAGDGDGVVRMKVLLIVLVSKVMA